MWYMVNINIVCIYWCVCGGWSEEVSIRSVSLGGYFTFHDFPYFIKYKILLQVVTRGGWMWSGGGPRGGSPQSPQSVYYWENTFQDVLWKPQEHSQDTTYTIARVTWNVLRIIYQPQRIVNRMQGSRSLADESYYLSTNSIYLHKKKESLNILKYLLTCLSL